MIGLLLALLAPTFLTTPAPIQDGFLYAFAGCGYVANSQVYFVAFEAGEHYQEFFDGPTPTDAGGCFQTVAQRWIWGPGSYDVRVLQKRDLSHRLRVVLRAEVVVE